MKVNNRIDLSRGMVIILLTFVGMLVSCLECAAVNTEDVLTGLKNQADDISGIKSNFVQERHSSMFQKPRISKGFFRFTAPNSLHWEYVSPTSSGFSVNGETGEKWNRSGERIGFRIKNDRIMRLTVERLLPWMRFDLESLRKDYLIEVLSDKPPVLKFTPRAAVRSGEEERVWPESIKAEFASSGFVMKTLEIRDKDGDMTRLMFSDTELTYR